MTSITSKEKEEKYSCHHILPKSRRGSNDPCNLEMIKDNRHRAIHTLFQNQLIAEQLITTVNISAKALRDDVRKWLIDTLTTKNIYDPFEWYNEECIK